MGKILFWLIVSQFDRKVISFIHLFMFHLNTGEVSGGGLIGNLLTQSSNVELSLWPETKYRVQVTCKNKVSDRMLLHSYISMFI